MLNYKILDAEGIVIVEPSGPLQKTDFEKLTKDVDAHIERRVGVGGLIIHAKSFPGWENFAAFCSHLRFVKNHHKKIDFKKEYMKLLEKHEIEYNQRYIFD